MAEAVLQVKKEKTPKAPSKAELAKDAEAIQKENKRLEKERDAAPPMRERELEVIGG